MGRVHCHWGPFIVKEKFFSFIIWFYFIVVSLITLSLLVRRKWSDLFQDILNMHLYLVLLYINLFSEEIVKLSEPFIFKRFCIFIKILFTLFLLAVIIIQMYMYVV